MIFFKYFYNKIMGHTYCTHFTMWENNQGTFHKYFGMLESNKVEYIRKWQERKCIDCGKLQQREVEW